MDPLENVLDFYGGNSYKMMVMDDFFTSDSLTDLDQQPLIGKDIDFKDELLELTNSRSESMQSHI